MDNEEVDAAGAAAPVTKRARTSSAEASTTSSGSGKAGGGSGAAGYDVEALRAALAASIAARANAEERAEQERVEKELARAARLRMEERAEKARREREAAATEFEAVRLAAVLDALCAASLVLSNMKEDPKVALGSEPPPVVRRRDAHFRVEKRWNAVDDPKIAALLARVTPVVAEAVRVCCAPLAAEISTVRLKDPATTHTAAFVGKVLRAVAGATAGTGGARGEWRDDVTLTARMRRAVEDKEYSAQPGHAWLPQPHRVANVATVTMTVTTTTNLDDDDAVAHIVQAGALRLYNMLDRHFFNAPLPAVRAALQPCNYSLATDGLSLVVVRLSGVSDTDEKASHLYMERSVALPLWGDDKTPSVCGLPLGLAVLAALTLAEGDELGSRAVVPPAGLDFVHVPLRSADDIGNAATWAPAMPLADNDGGGWWLLGSGSYADVYACVAEGATVVVKAARHPGRQGDCLLQCLDEAAALAVLGNATPVGAGVGCPYIPRLLGGAWQGTSLVALVLAGVGATFNSAVARVHGADRWAVVVHAIHSVLQALVHAHAAGVAHRDVRAPNVILAASPSAACGACLNDWGLAQLDAPPDDMGRDLCAAKLLLLELGDVSPVGARAHDYEDLSELPAPAALVECCDGFPAGAAHVACLKAFLTAACVPDALAALAPLHAALAPQLGALEWVEWREA